MVPIWDCSCSRELGQSLFGSIYVADSLDGAYLGTVQYNNMIQPDTEIGCNGRIQLKMFDAGMLHRYAK